MKQIPIYINNRSELARSHDHHRHNEDHYHETADTDTLESGMRSRSGSFISFASRMSAHQDEMDDSNQGPMNPSANHESNRLSSSFSSAWNNDSTIPMTSRPHFCSYLLEQNQIVVVHSPHRASHDDAIENIDHKNVSDMVVATDLRLLVPSLLLTSSFKLAAQPNLNNACDDFALPNDELKCISSASSTSNRGHLHSQLIAIETSNAVGNDEKVVTVLPERRSYHIPGTEPLSNSNKVQENNLIPNNHIFIHDGNTKSSTEFSLVDEDMSRNGNTESIRDNITNITTEMGKNFTETGRVSGLLDDTNPSHHQRCDIEVEKRTKSSSHTNSSNSIPICIMYGMINATIVLPVLISFGSIVYRDDAFRPYQQKLIQLTVFSGIVHQIAFSTFSSLPFAVGQVQDAGLIFLSSMATAIVHHCQDQADAYGNRLEYNAEKRDEVMLATTTVLLGCCTAVLGVALVAIGHFRLAQYVQLLPTSVVGGYLAFIGWFCGESGLGLMAGSSELTLSKLLSISTIQFMLPGIVCGIGIYVAIRNLRHMAVLPSCMFGLLFVFHLILWCTGTSIQEATERGWMHSLRTNATNESSTGISPWLSWFNTWDYLRFDLVDWSIIPKLISTELSMIFVVALSSSLDVAAIELELREQAQQQQKQHDESTTSPTLSHDLTFVSMLPLDYNRELQTVGISNVLSGLTGGYTGSYIFSQSIFSLRAGIKSRLSGYVLAFCQLFVLILPYPILSYVPNFLFGSMLTCICVDLLFEWLWEIRRKVSTVEYVICWITFVSIHLLGNVEYGIIMGVTAHLIIVNQPGCIRKIFTPDSVTELQQQESLPLTYGNKLPECCGKNTLKTGSVSTISVTTGCISNQSTYGSLCDDR